MFFFLSTQYVTQVVIVFVQLNISSIFMYNTLSVDALVSELTCLQSILIDCNCASYLDLDRPLNAKISHCGRGEQTWLSLAVAQERTCVHATCLITL